VGAAVFHNLAGGTFDVQIDNQIGVGNSTATFTNDGSFTKSAGSGTTDVALVFNNNGKATVSSGTLRLTRSGTVGAPGSIDVTTGTALDFASNYTLATGSMVSSPLVIFSAGTVNVNGDYTATAETRVSGGTANFNAAG